jgi:hypothetical protein
MFAHRHVLVFAAAIAVSLPALADENLLGYVRGAETLPKGSGEFYQWFTHRSDKGAGHYRALDTKTEIEYGVTDRFQVSAELNGLAINTRGLLIDGYLPADKKSGLRARSVELGMKYNFLSPAKDDVGLSGIATLEYGVLDPHSGQKKSEVEVEVEVQAQKYFMEGQLVLIGNLGMRSAREKRKPLANLPEGFDWPLDPEMELQTKMGAGLSYRFAPGWYAGAEVLREAEYETEVGLERWSTFGGPSLHYAGKQWWATLTAFRQLRGGGEKYEGQGDQRLHLIEKTRNEVRLKLGYNF